MVPTKNIKQIQKKIIKLLKLISQIIQTNQIKYSDINDNVKI